MRHCDSFFFPTCSFIVFLTVIFVGNLVSAEESGLGRGDFQRQLFLFRLLHNLEDSNTIDLHLLIENLSRINNLQPNYLASIVWIESTAQPCAISPSVIVNGTKVHAKGLGQLMPGTASYLGVNDVFEPESNLEGAAKYFSEQLMDANGDLLLAASAYNYGPRALNKPFNQLPKETQDYTRKFGKFLDLFHEDAWRDFLPRIIPRTNTKICESAIALENS